MTKTRLSLAVAFLFFGLLAFAQSNIAERLNVDATDAPRNILHATITIPVAPGAFRRHGCAKRESSSSRAWLPRP